MVRATFVELDTELKDEKKPGGRSATVQFNPETLKVSFANAIEQPKGGGDNRGQAARQFVGAGTTKLSLTLLMDVTAPPYSDQGKKDVRELTQQVAYFITPRKNTVGTAEEQTQMVPPGVRFLWGSFKFDGMMDSLEESLEYFSPDGRPLRATLTVAMSQQKITEFFKGGGAQAGSGSGLGSPGTRPLASASAGVSLQAMADAHGSGSSWQSIASANGIENPRRPGTGRLVDLNASVSIG
jgi:hypothetical protein